MQWIDYNRTLLALVIWREARGEGLEGMRACAHVIANRVREWHKDYSKIITDRNQFTSISVPSDAQTVLWPVRPNSMFEAAMDIASKVYDETDMDITQGALYYANLKVANSPWFQENIVGKPELHPVTAVIGAHTFFK